MELCRQVRVMYSEIIPCRYHFVHHESYIWTGLVLNPGVCGERLANNRLNQQNVVSCGTNSDRRGRQIWAEYVESTEENQEGSLPE